MSVARTSVVFFAGLMVLALLAFGLSACGRETVHEPAAAEATGERYQVTSAAVADLKPVTATITTRDMGEARARIGGVLTQLLVSEGDQVRAGQRLAVITDDRLNLEIGAYAAQAEAVGAEAERARRDLERTQALVERGVYAPARLDQDLAAAEAAQKRHEAALAQRNAAAEIAAQGAVLAPSSGRVLSAPVPAGSAVMAGQSLVVVTSGPPVVRLELPEAQASALRTGLSIAVSGLSVDGGEVVGQVAEIYPSVMAGMVRADLRLPGLDDKLVGRRVQALVPLGERQAIVIPVRFISTRFGVDYVRVLGPDGAAGEIPVQLAPGPDTASREVLSGLSAGDVILAPAS